ncbi:MAG: hypothetical protein ACQEVA_05745 [Myxococcota bacterium]
MHRTSFQVVLVVVLGIALSGCATYSDNVKAAQDAVKYGENKKAIGLINEELGIETAADLPEDYKGEKPLLLLERATVLQSIGEYEMAARDMIAVDDRLEYLDLMTADRAQVGKWLYSGASNKYRAPPYERLLLNTLNMVNFLAMRDVQGAKVEARRFALLEYFFVEKQDEEVMGGILGLGNYLGGAAFEASQDYENAARYYARALYYGVKDPGLRERVIDLFAITGHTPSELQQNDPEALAGVIEEAKTTTPLTFQEYFNKWRRGDTIFLIQTGLAPYKIPKRVPVVQALNYQQRYAYYGWTVSSATRSNAEMLVYNGVLNTVNFPMLTRRNIPVNQSVDLEVGGEGVHNFGYVDVATQVENAWNRIAGALMAAAITRMVTRAIASQAASTATSAAAGDEGLGALAGLAVKATMTAADKPDTRSWILLPSEIRIARMQLPADVHQVKVKVGFRDDTRSVTVRENSLNLVNFSRLR